MNYVWVIVVWVIEHTALGLFPPCVLHTNALCSGIQYLLYHLFVLGDLVRFVVHVHLTLQGEGSYTFPPIYRGKKTKVVSFNVFNSLQPYFWLLFAILATTK